MVKAKGDKKKSRRAVDASGGKDRKSARKFKRGGRIEAYTFGEVTGKKGSNWPF